MTKDKEKSKFISCLNGDILKVKKSLNNIRNDIEKIENGDGTNPYWNGELAYSSLKQLIDQYNKDIKIVSKLEKILINYK